MSSGGKKDNNKPNSAKDPKSDPNQKKSSGKEKQKTATPHWWVYTKVNSDFIVAAKELSDMLHDRFGDVTITHFEKAMTEISSLPDEEYNLVFLDDCLLDALRNYQSAREKRDEERRSFRSVHSVEGVAATIDKVRARLNNQNAGPSAQAPSA